VTNRKPARRRIAQRRSNRSLWLRTGALVVAAVAFVSAMALLGARRPPDPPAPQRLVAVVEGVAPERQAAIWRLLRLARIPERCATARIWSIASAEAAAAASHFVLRCEGTGYFLVTDDPQSGAQGSVGPFADLAAIERQIDPRATFDWPVRRAHLRPPSRS
jgi:hypothetical protein